MNNNERVKNLVRLFGMSGLQLATEKENLQKKFKIDLGVSAPIQLVRDPDYYPQFDLEVRSEAEDMAQYYEIFYCLENSVRNIIRERMSQQFKDDWWDIGVQQNIRDEVENRIKRDLDSSFTLRSEDNLDFATLGELQHIIDKNWECFEDLFKSRNALRRVLTNLNFLRGPIAHCCGLAEDEIVRLHLTVKDWFRLMS